MAKAKRVFQLAKEIGVDSKAILEKCQAEGVDLNNHMSTVSLGLEMTIREWFSEEPATSTAVETAEKVDLTKVRRARPRKRISSFAQEQEQEEEPTLEEVGAEPETEETTAEEVEAPSVESEEMPAEVTLQAQPQEEGEAAPEAPAAETPAPPVAETAEPEKPVEEVPEAPRPEEPAPAETAAEPTPVPAAAEQPQPQEETEEEPVEEQPAQEQPEEARPAAQEEQPEEEEEQGMEEDQESTKAGAVPNVPRRPKVVAPAGPRLEAPKAAKLKGPRVVRIEEPEQIRRPRTRRPTGPEAPAPGGQPDIIRSRGPVRGRGASKGGTAEEEAARSPRRKRARRGGRDEGKGRGWSEQDLLEREERINKAGGFLRQRRRDMRNRSHATSTTPTPAQVGGTVEISEPFTIKDLSAATGIKAADIIAFLFNKGIMATINQTIEIDAAVEIALEYNIDLVVKEAQSAEEAVVEELEQRVSVDVQRRPPVVAVLGHVDHGKTSLLDRIREDDVASGESGGITQHIGAYRASIEGSDGKLKTVVFLDTPGHAAFTTMRARGANLTDLVVLVVAADDGVMPQTIESINHAKAAGVSIVVALNKIDRPDATDSNIQKILGQLAEQGLNPVEWGGETEVIKTSAHTGQGITDLIEVLDYQAELLELTADYGGHAHGSVIEAELDPGRGSVARLLVRQGQLRVGDFVVMGRAFGRVRDIIDDRGQNVQEAGPATPVEISGIDEVPDAGDKFYVTDSLKKAEEIATTRRDQERKKELASRSKVSLDNVFERMKAEKLQELRVVVKADVQGSIEVLRQTISELSNDEVSVRVLHAAVGGITESDVLLAEASEAIIVGFHVIASPQARAEAERRGVDVRLYRVIYDITEDITRALEGMLAPEQREEVLGHAEVRDVFRVSRVGSVAGCYVTDGVVRRNALIRVTRDGIVIEHDRTLDTLKRFKDDVREVRQGMECGMKIEAYDDIRVGDVLECYVTTEVARTL